MKVKIMSIVSALLIAVLMFTSTAPAVIGETNFEKNPDQTDGTDSKFMSDTPGLTETMGGMAIGAAAISTTYGVVTGISSAAAVTATTVVTTVLSATGVGIFAAAIVIGVFSLIWWLFS